MDGNELRNQFTNQIVECRETSKLLDTAHSPFGGFWRPTESCPPREAPAIQPLSHRFLGQRRLPNELPQNKLVRLVNGELLRLFSICFLI